MGPQEPGQEINRESEVSMGSRIAAAFTLIVVGVIVADILIHPDGTTAAANGVASILKPSYSALLGTAPK